MNTLSLKQNFKEDALQIGNKIYSRRKELGIQQKDLSAFTRLPYQTISAIENGNRIASVKTLVMIAEELHVPLTRLQPDKLDKYLEISPDLYLLHEKLQALPPILQHKMIKMFLRQLEVK